MKNYTSTLIFCLMFAGVCLMGCKKEAPEASFSFTVDEFTVSFTSASTGDIDDFAWDFGDGTTGTGATTSHTYDAAGEYQVTLTVSNKKDNDSDSKTVTIESPPGDPGTLTFDGADGVCVAVRTTTMTGGFPFTLGTATATFFDGSGGIVDAGTVSVDGNDLDKNPNNSYVHVAGLSSPNGLTFGNEVHWVISGGNGIPNIDYTTDAADDHVFPTVDAINSATTIPTGSDYTLASPNVLDADSVLFIISDGSGKSIHKTLSQNAASHTFTTADLSALSAGTGIAQIAAYTVRSKNFSGKTVYFVNEEVSSVTVEIQ